MTLLACTSGQSPYVAVLVDGSVIANTGAATPWASCGLYRAASAGVSIPMASEGLCGVTMASGTTVYREIRQVCTQFDETDPFALTTAEGAAITGAILLVWALGFAFRVLKQSLDIDGNNANSTSESE